MTSLNSIPENEIASISQNQLANESNAVDETTADEPFVYRDDWELTWPIWHMLSRNERKSIAQNHGYKSIGEFEEFMTLQRAVDDSQGVYDNSLAYPQEEVAPRNEDTEAIEAREVSRDDQQHPADPESEDEEDAPLDEPSDLDRLGNTEELVEWGGRILLLPDEIIHRLFAFLPVDQYASLALVSPHWRSFTRTEAVYQRLCERLYLQQSKRRTLHVARFENSYRTMLERRPRVRAGGGVYVIKYSQVKKIQRDMWTETVYYRYLYFQEDGYVWYALTTRGPHEMIPRLRMINIKASLDDAVVCRGRYVVSGTRVTVSARQPWQYIQLVLSIQSSITLHGRYGYLTFDRHVTSAKDDFPPWDASTVEFDVPEGAFRFVRDRRL